MSDPMRRITINPEQCGGRPCIRGMRIRVIDVLDLLAAGLSAQQVLEELSCLISKWMTSKRRSLTLPDVWIIPSWWHDHLAGRSDLASYRDLDHSAVRSLRHRSARPWASRINRSRGLFRRSASRRRSDDQG